MKLNDNHPVFDACKITHEIAAPLLEKFNLNYFQYARVYANGNSMLFINRIDWMKFYLENEHHIVSSIKPEQLDKQTYFFTWDGNLPDYATKLARDRGDMTQGLTLVKRHPEYYDMIAFAAPSDNQFAMDHYINNIAELQQFCLHFQDAASPMIMNPEKYTLALPSHMQDANKDKMILQQQQHRKRYSIIHGNISSYVTEREKQIIHSLLKNTSQKIVAQELSLSVRTVETYLSRAKQRLGCHSTHQLLQLVSQQLPMSGIITDIF